MGIVADDKFATASSGAGPIDGPIREIAAATASASELAFLPRAVFVASTGNLTITDVAGTSVVLNNVAPGVWHWMRPVKITATTTGAIRIGR